MASAVKYLTLACRLTQKEEYLLKTVELSQYLLDKDPVEIFSTSDFAGANAMYILTSIYDVYVYKLDDENRKKYEILFSQFSNWY